MAAEDPLAYLYPLDLTGAVASNKVPNERKTVNPPSEEFEFNIILPAAAPYYRDTMVLKSIATGKALVKGVDWAPGHRFVTASTELNNLKGGIYGSILLYDRKFSGQVTMTYQTLGDNWTLSESKLLEILSNRAVDPRFVTYEQVSGKPEVFPTIDHSHHVDDLTGFRELITANYDIAAAIREKTQTFLNNPPILLGQYYTADQVDAKLEAANQGGADQELGQLIDTMSTNYSDASTKLKPE